MVGGLETCHVLSPKQVGTRVPGMFFFFFFSFIKLFLIILTKTDTLCREMEVAGAEKGRDLRCYASQVPGMLLLLLLLRLLQGY